MLKEHEFLFKGINPGLIKAIFTKLDELDNPGIRIHTGVELKNIMQGFNLELFHQHTEKTFAYQAKGLILATGYQYSVPGFLSNLKEHIHWTGEGWYDIEENYKIKGTGSIFVQNAELHSHGFNAADLSLGPYRNAVILNAILGKKQYHLEEGSLFQSFD